MITTDTRTARCFTCDWTFSGPSTEVRDAGIEHRAASGHHFALEDAEANGAAGYPCKVEGCAETALRNRGPTAYLCTTHVAQRAAKRSSSKSPVAKPKPEPTLDELLEDVRQAQAQVDEARKRRNAALDAFDADVKRRRDALLTAEEVTQAEVYKETGGPC